MNTTEQSRVLITGNTYPVREQLREMGGVWDRSAYGWRVPADQADGARRIVASAGPARERAARRQRSNRYAGYTRFSTGAEVYQNPRGRCEDAPCCGCCS